MLVRLTQVYPHLSVPSPASPLTCLSLLTVYLSSPVSLPSPDSLYLDASSHTKPLHLHGSLFYRVPSPVCVPLSHSFNLPVSPHVSMFLVPSCVPSPALCVPSPFPEFAVSSAIALWRVSPHVPVVCPSRVDLSVFAS